MEITEFGKNKIDFGGNRFNRALKMSFLLNF